MVNAKQEIVEHVAGRCVEYVIVVYSPDGSCRNRIVGVFEDVLPLLDFRYDNGYGRQELFGFIWYADGTWSERRVYDGSEGWRHIERPTPDDIS